MIYNNKNICVFASASADLDEIYYQHARELGLLIAKEGYGIVYGGSRRGLMYACAGAVKESGGKVYGVLPQKLANYGLANPEDCDELFIEFGMRERKAKLDEISDAVIAIAGGFGTLEEISEMISQKQLGYNEKPIVILNTAGFYDDLVKFFDNIIANRFAGENSDKAYYIATTPKEAVDYIKNYKPDFSFVKYKNA
ncbi:MAG: TIGR00730 family Rossman fold protein [bacterium]|nr:TIGR00730 family Rossman fold protein [bacterium]